MENKYYTPSIKDIRIGFSCLFNTTPSWKEDKPNWIEIMLKEEDINNYSPYDGDMSLIDEILYSVKEGKVKVPYLTKEGIEKEGWVYTGKSIDIWFEKEVDLDMGSWTAYKVKLQYGLHNNRLRIFTIDLDKTEYDCFTGICPSINEFRYITNNLLKIN